MCGVCHNECASHESLAGKVRARSADEKWQTILSDSLYQLCCGLLRSLREANCAEVNLLEDPEFQMKKQNAAGE